MVGRISRYGRQISLDESSDDYNSYASSLSASQFTMTNDHDHFDEEIESNLDFYPNIERDQSFTRHSSYSSKAFFPARLGSRSRNGLKVMFLLFFTALIFIIVFFGSVGVMDRIFRKRSQAIQPAESANLSGGLLSSLPTISPTSLTISPNPSILPTTLPTIHIHSTLEPTSFPIKLQSSFPSLIEIESLSPSIQASDLPTEKPSVQLSHKPSSVVTQKPSSAPSSTKPSIRNKNSLLSSAPSTSFTSKPSNTSSSKPTEALSQLPSSTLSDSPSNPPSISSTSKPTSLPTTATSISPSLLTSDEPTIATSPIGIPTTTIFTITSGSITQKDLIQELGNQANNVEFLVHLGNFISKDVNCTSDSFSDFHDVLMKSKINVPIFLLPGEHEINADCLPTDADADADKNSISNTEPLDHWQDIFSDLPDNFFHSFTFIEHPTSPSPSPRAVFSMFHNGVLFIGLNLLRLDGWSDSEYSNLLTQNRDWIQIQMQHPKVQTIGLRSVVLFGTSEYNNDNASFFKDVAFDVDSARVPALYLYDSNRVESHFPVGDNMRFVGIEDGRVPFMNVVVKTDGGKFAFQFVLQ